MLPLRHPDNTKVCPGCGTCLMDTARHCSMCGYVFLESEIPPARPARQPKGLRVTLSLPGLLALVLALALINTVLILGWQKRAETRVKVQSVNATSTFVATTYVSPTPTTMPTQTPGPPTPTPIVDIEYTVVSGDSCISVATQFNVSLTDLLRLNDINCDLLSIGTVLIIPAPTPTPEPSVTPEETLVPLVPGS